jgi:hypothetical protein
MFTRLQLGILISVAAISSSALAQSNLRPCGWGHWQMGEECRRPDGTVCKIISYPLAGAWQTHCEKSKAAHLASRVTIAQRKAVNARPVENTKSISVVHAEFPAATREATVLAGQRTQVYSAFYLNPDCTPVGPIVVRTLKAPLSGKFENEAGTGFPAYKADNSRFKCNEQRHETTLIYYTANASFVGKDQAEVELFYSDGHTKHLTFLLQEK